MSPSSRTHELRALVDLVNKASEIIIGEWDKEESLNQRSQDSKQGDLSSWGFYNAQRTIVSACGSFTELVHNPQLRLIEVSAEFLESRALHIAAEHRIADMLACAEHKGVFIDNPAAKTGIDALKLARVLRVLTSAHIQEVKEDHFANNHVSACLVNNEPLRAYILVLGVDTFTGACKLISILRDPAKTHSTSPVESPLCEAIGISLTYWDWLGTDVERSDRSTGPNTSLETFTLGMLGNGRVMSGPACFDYRLSLVVLGQRTCRRRRRRHSMSLDLARLYPDLHFVRQDRPALIKQGEMVWAAEYSEALSSRVALTPHDFFQENPIKGADTYLLRYIIHDWQDDQSVEILKGIRASMAAHSRVLVVDQVMNTALG